MPEALPAAPPFRMEIFESYEEFEHYLHTSDALRGSRWLHERSLASSAEWLVLPGTCGLCLQPTQFKALTHGGELAPGGRVPNWREGLACDCTHALVNRERALLHYLLAHAYAEPWMRVLALGDYGALNPMLAKLVGSIDGWPGPLKATLEQAARPQGGYHLIVSVEQLNAELAQQSLLSKMGQLLAPGGALVFTAPFDIKPPTKESAGDGLVGWSVLDLLTNCGFATARACTYWSEEMGYLGAFNFIITAFKS